jgi:hypothetical protein
VVAGTGLVTGTILWLVAGSGDEDKSAPPTAEDAPPGDAEEAGVRLMPMVGVGAVGLRGAF